MVIKFEDYDRPLEKLRVAGPETRQFYQWKIQKVLRDRTDSRKSAPEIAADLRVWLLEQWENCCENLLSGHKCQGET